jgi:hypothetical protein
MPHSVGVIEAYDDVGLLARDARLSGAGFADATEQELRLLEDQGALARQRFIQANLGLVGMVSRQFAVRCLLPNADLFQEGCLGRAGRQDRCRSRSPQDRRRQAPLHHPRRPIPRPEMEAERQKKVHEARVKIVPRVCAHNQQIFHEEILGARSCVSVRLPARSD